MVSTDKTLLRIERAASLLGVCQDTLRAWEKQGKISPIRTHGGQRRFRLSEIENLRGEAIAHIDAQQPVMPSCSHTDRKHYAKGLCKSCYYNAYYKANPEYQAAKKVTYIKLFGMSKEWFDEQVAKGCAICGTVDWAISGKPCIDHDHNCCLGCSKCVRGVLCGRCNRMLGHAADNVDTLRNAIVYLENHNSKNA